MIDVTDTAHWAEIEAESVHVEQGLYDAVIVPPQGSGMEVDERVWDTMSRLRSALMGHIPCRLSGSDFVFETALMRPDFSVERHDVRVSCDGKRYVLKLP